LLVRSKDEVSFEIVFGARRYRAAQMAEATTVPVRIKYMTDAEVLEAQLIENLQHRDVHPIEEAHGFKALLDLEEPKYSIEQNVLLLLKDAPFDKRNGHLVAIAGSCTDCPKRTGHNKLLFADLGKQDACADPSCYQAKVDAHVAKTLTEKPKLVQISTAYIKPQDGSPVVPRGTYVAIQDEKPKDKQEAQRPEYKECKFTTEAIITDGEGKARPTRSAPIPSAPSITPSALTGIPHSFFARLRQQALSSSGF
jgi:hypothetical protein